MRLDTADWQALNSQALYDLKRGQPKPRRARWRERTAIAQEEEATHNHDYECPGESHDECPEHRYGMLSPQPRANNPIAPHSFAWIGNTRSSARESCIGRCTSLTGARPSATSYLPRNNS